MRKTIIFLLAILFLNAAIVCAQDDDDVVDAALHPHVLGAGGVGQADRAVIGGVLRVVAPAVVGGDRLQIEGGGRCGTAIGAVEHAADRPDASRGRAIAFALVGRGLHAVRAERATHLLAPKIEETIGRSCEVHRGVPKCLCSQA